MGGGIGAGEGEAGALERRSRRRGGRSTGEEEQEKGREEQ